MLAWVFAAAAISATVRARDAEVITPVTRDTVVLRLEPRATRSASTLPAREQADRLQYQHRFAEAEAVLDDWLASHPEDAAARVERARLRVAQDRPREALADCARATAALEALVATGCRAEAMGALGAVAPARAMLEAALSRSGAIPEAGSWARGIAAELAARDGDHAAAERWHRAALATAGDAHYPRVAYAEFLLARGRARDVLELLADAPDDATVMRLRRQARDAST